MKLSRTNQRKVILEELQKLTSHPTADELCHIVRKRLPQVSLATVYRNLEQLSQAGIILKLETAGRQKRFDGNPKRHYHMRCKECGRVLDIDYIKFASIEKQLSVILKDLECDDYQLEVSGRCENCRAAPATIKE